MVMESWFRNLWRASRKQEVGPEMLAIGVLAFEVASLMSKLVHLWQSLSDKQVARLRDEITNSAGIKKLVSDDDDYVVSLVCSEMIENMTHVAKSLARLAEKCSDPGLKSFSHLFGDLIKFDVDPYGWELTWKKMEKKVKKMDRLISANAHLYQEMEILVELEQTLKRLKIYKNSDINLPELQKKAAWKWREVKHLQEASLWNKTYDYAVRLLGRSLFTIYGRIKHVFGINPAVDHMKMNTSEVVKSDLIHQGHSVSALIQSPAYPSKDGLRFFVAPVEKLLTRSGPISTTINSSTGKFYSGPLSTSAMKTDPTSGKNIISNFYSGFLVKTATKSGSLFGLKRSRQFFWRKHNQSSTPQWKNSNSRPSKGCVMGGSTYPVSTSQISPNSVQPDILRNVHHTQMSSLFCPKPRLLNAPPETLGGTALAFHYANVIILIEKLVAYPHLIGDDARDDLYSMLPTSIQAALRARLKPYAKSLASTIYDSGLAADWTDAMTAILEWLAPLAHNMIRWQSDRSFEHQNYSSKGNVLLVQTLYFANQDKTEATITELLVGLNYIWRTSRELDAKSLEECPSSGIFGEYLNLEG